jgi:predicted transposase/invertase (TIGR01784 family)
MNTKTSLQNVNLLNDAMFKALFRSVEAREMVSKFLNAITGIPVNDLMNASYQGGELPKKNIKEKGKTSDIIIRIENDKHIILECNQHYSDNIFEKNTSYLFSIASEKIKINTKRYPVVILVNIDNFNFYKTRKPILHFQARDEEGIIEHDLYNSFHIILENIGNTKYNIDTEIKKVSELLKMTQIREMKEKFKGDESYMAAIRKVEDLSTDPNFIGYYDIEEARRQDLEDMKNTGIRIGMERGVEKGITNEKIEIAKKMMDKNMSIEDIIELTSLSKEEIEKLM